MLDEIEDIDYEEYLAPGSTLLFSAKAQLDESNESINLVPKPSSDPNDPLNWLPLKKKFQLVLLFLWALLQAASANFNAPIWTTWNEELGWSFTTMTNAAAVTFLLIGISGLFTFPLALKYGRKFVYFISTILMLIGLGVGCNLTSLARLYVFAAFSGIGTAPIQSLTQFSSTDFFFQHERSTYISILVCAGLSGTYLGPLVAGYISAIGWKWTYYVMTILTGALLLAVVFLMEDTSFRRSNNEDVQSTIDIMEEEGDRIEQPTSKTVEGSTDAVAVSSMNSNNEEIKKMNYWQRIKIIQFKQSDPRSLWFLFSIQLIPGMFPAVIWASFLFFLQSNWLSLFIATQSLVFAGEPYNFSDSAVGLTNLSPFVGGLLGMAYVGPFLDFLAVRLAKRNNGIMEPEFRLWAIVIPMLVSVAGLLSYGLGINNEMHWFLLAGFGAACLGFSIVAVSSIAVTFSIECVPNFANEALIFTVAMGSIMAFFFMYYVQNWIDVCGWALFSWLNVMLSLLIHLFFLVFIFWGKKFRLMLKELYYRYSNRFKFDEML